MRWRLKCPRNGYCAAVVAALSLGAFCPTATASDAGQDARPGPPAAAAASLKVSTFALCLSGKISAAKGELVRYYAKELRGLAQFWVLYDSTCRYAQRLRDPPDVTSPCGRLEDLEKLERLARHARAKLLVYDDEVIRERYPFFGDEIIVAFDDQPRNLTIIEMPNMEAQRRRRLLLPRTTAVPATFLGLWLEELLKTVPREQLGFLWVVESDALYAGHVSDFLRDVASHVELQDTDYLSPILLPLAEIPDWPHQNKGTWPVPYDYVRVGFDVIQRFSPEMLSALSDAVSMNLMLHPNALPATLCAVSGWCKAAKLPGAAAAVRGPVYALRHHHRSEQCTFGRGCQVTLAQFQANLMNDSLAPAWYHRCGFVDSWKAKDIYSALR